MCDATTAQKDRPQPAFTEADAADALARVRQRTDAAGNAARGLEEARINRGIGRSDDTVMADAVYRNALIDLHQACWEWVWITRWQER